MIIRSVSAGSQPWSWNSNWVSIWSKIVGRMGFGKPKSYPQWHTVSNKTAPPNPTQKEPKVLKCQKKKKIQKIFLPKQKCSYHATCLYLFFQFDFPTGLISFQSCKVEFSVKGQHLLPLFSMHSQCVHFKKTVFCFNYLPLYGYMHVRALSLEALNDSNFWDWSYRQLWAAWYGCQEPLRCLQEQDIPLTSEPSVCIPSTFLQRCLAGRFFSRAVELCTLIPVVNGGI